MFLMVRKKVILCVYLQVRVGERIKARVVLIKDDFILVCLRGNVQGQLAYVPAKRVSV